MRTLGSYLQTHYQVSSHRRKRGIEHMSTNASFIPIDIVFICAYIRLWLLHQPNCREYLIGPEHLAFEARLSTFEVAIGGNDIQVLRSALLLENVRCPARSPRPDLRPLPEARGRSHKNNDKVKSLALHKKSSFLLLVVWVTTSFVRRL